MKHRTRYTVLFLSFVLLLSAFFACKKKETKVDMHLNYFGLIPGRYVLYEVQEMFHDAVLSPAHDTTRYQLKTLIGPEFIDNEGRKAREFRRFKRSDSSQDWVETDLWTAIIENYKAELVEENQRIVKLVFAPTSDKTWNPNAFNTQEELNYSYTDIHIPKTFNGFSFDSTITVFQEEFTSMIDFKKKHETYATNIGLVSKTYKNLTIANFDSLNVKKGTEIHYKCIGYGYE